MKNSSNKNIISKLNHLREALGFLACPESRTIFLQNLDDLIMRLNDLRVGLSNAALQEKALEIQQPLERVISFLEFAKTDETFKVLLSAEVKSKTSKPKRQAVEIPNSLTNEQIRDLLRKELSKSELKAIAVQRAISVGKSNSDGIKQNILKNLDRQESYMRLAGT